MGARTYPELERGYGQPNAVLEEFLSGDKTTKKRKLAANCFEADVIHLWAKGEKLAPAYSFIQTLADHYDDSTNTKKLSLPTNFRDDVNKIFNPDGTWKFQISPEAIDQALQMPTKQFIEYISGVVRVLYTPAQPLLDSNSFGDGGFNNHTFEVHIRQVMRDTVYLGETAGLSDYKINLAALAVVFHDSGNTFGRSIHPHASVEIILKSAGKEAREALIQDEDWQQVLYAVECHDESVGHAITSQLIERVYADNPDKLKKGDVESKKELTEEFFRRFALVFSKTASLLRGSDKAHNGIERLLNSNDLSYDALDKDAHFKVNAFCPGAFLRFYKAKGRLTLHIPFSLTVPPKYADQRQKLIKNPKQADVAADGTTQYQAINPQLIVPDSMSKIYKSDQSTFFKQWTEEIVKLYKSRLSVAAADFFNVLGEKMNEFEVHFYEVDKNIFPSPTKKTTRQEARMKFRREDFISDFENPQLQFRDVPESMLASLPIQEQEFPAA